MPSKLKSLKASRRPTANERALERVQIAANAYCIRHFAIGYSGGAPRRLSLKGSNVWIVPVVFTSPGYGVVGEVGIVAIDAGTHEVIGATPRAEVKAAGARLAQENRDALDAAFRETTKP
jgi:voltage-gated potassium channel Kch